MAGHSKSNVSKKDPIIYGEYLVGRMKEENVTQTQLASVLGENRTELGRYVKIGKWSSDFKFYVSENKDKISNTHLIKAARDFKDEDQASDYIKDIVRQASAGSTLRQTQPPNPVKPIRNNHMLDCLVNENRKLESEICDLKECIISLNKKVSSLPSYEADHTEKSLHDRGEKQDTGNTSDTHKQCITWRIKIRDITGFFADLRFTAMCAILWICLIPVTAMFVEHCLESFSFDKLKYLSLVPLSSLALMLAVTIDVLIFNLIKLNQWPARVCGGVLIFLNCCGAYFISSKNTNALEIQAYQSNLLSKEKRIANLEEEAAILYANYLTIKWPNQANPHRCESSEMDCGLPFSTKAQEIHTEYIAAKNLLNSNRETLQKMESLPISLKHTSLNETYWHLGYYIFLWILLLLTAWIQYIHINSASIVRRVKR